MTQGLEIGEYLIYKWKKDFLKTGHGQRSGEQLQEIEVLKKRNRELGQEMGGRFCYLAMWQDLVTKRIVGWSLSGT